MKAHSTVGELTGVPRWWIAFGSELRRRAVIIFLLEKIVALKKI